METEGSTPVRRRSDVAGVLCDWPHRTLPPFVFPSRRELERRRREAELEDLRVLKNDGVA